VLDPCVQVELSPKHQQRALTHAGDFEPTLGRAQNRIYPSVIFKFETRESVECHAQPL